MGKKLRARIVSRCAHAACFPKNDPMGVLNMPIKRRDQGVSGQPRKELATSHGSHRSSGGPRHDISRLKEESPRGSVVRPSAIHDVDAGFSPAPKVILSKPILESAKKGLGRRQIVVALLALVIGTAFIAYPFVSNSVNQSREKQVVEAVGSAVSATDEATLAAEREKAVTYNQQLLNGRAVVTDPFDPDAERPTDEDYDNVLNLSGDGVMATINIPKIHVELPVYHTTDSDVLEHGVGHLEGTSVPIGGESTHCVLSGHTGLPTMKIFDNLDQLEVGDYFVISVLGEDHAYEVTSVEVVLPDETDSLVIEQGRDLCTLVTCTPYGINSHRLLVHAERCEVPAEWLDKGEADFPSGYADPPDKALLPSVLLGLLLAALVIGGYVLVSKLRSRDRAASDSFSIPTGGPEGSPAGRHFAQPSSGSPRTPGGGAVGMRPALPRRRTRDGRGRRRG